MHISTSIPLLPTSSKSTRPESGCPPSIQLLLPVHRLASKPQVVLALVLLALLEPKPRDVHRLPSSHPILKELEVIKEPLPSHLLLVSIVTQCHHPPSNRLGIPTAIHHSTQLHVHQAVLFQLTNSAASHRRQVIKDFQTDSHRHPKLLMGVSLADMQAVFQPPTMVGFQLFKVCL